MKRFLCILLVCLVVAPYALGESKTEGVAESVVVTVGGDSVLGTRKTYETGPDTFETYIAEHGYTWPYRNFQEMFEKDDFTYVNLEGVFQDDETGYYPKEFSFRGPTEFAQILSAASIEHVNIANNHFGDYRKSGENSTIAALENEGIAYSGFRNVFVFIKGDIKIGFAGCRETVYKEKPGVVQQDLKELKALGCDVIIYSYHFGKEYSPTHNSLQESMAKYAIKNGADIIIGTHPHCVQGIDYIDGALVIYSLGNFVFGGTLDMSTFDAILGELELRFEDKVYQGVNLRIIPILTSGSAPKNDFSPVFAQDEDYKRIMQLVQNDTLFDVSENMWFPRKPEEKK
jgi:Putative enzyme of poly-gamma-glutamate biosynthesis (capsule formation)